MLKTQSRETNVVTDNQRAFERVGQLFTLDCIVNCKNFKNLNPGNDIKVIIIMHTPSGNGIDIVNGQSLNLNILIRNRA